MGLARSASEDLPPLFPPHRERLHRRPTRKGSLLCRHTRKAQRATRATTRRGAAGPVPRCRYLPRACGDTTRSSCPGAAYGRMAPCPTTCGTGWRRRRPWPGSTDRPAERAHRPPRSAARRRGTPRAGVRRRRGSPARARRAAAADLGRDGLPRHDRQRLLRPGDPHRPRRPAAAAGGELGVPHAADPADLRLGLRPPARRSALRPGAPRRAGPGPDGGGRRGAARRGARRRPRGWRTCATPFLA
jgi:hypothetical protein